MPISVNLDSETQARLNRLAAARHSSPEAILREALDQYLERQEQYLERQKEKLESTDDRHPSGKPWPRRTPVGGIITPV